MKRFEESKWIIHMKGLLIAWHIVVVWWSLFITLAKYLIKENYQLMISNERWYVINSLIISCFKIFHINVVNNILIITMHSITYM
jgi:hypothetical protein